MRKTLVVAMLVAVAGCSTHEEKVADLRTKHPEWNEEDCDRLVDHTTWVGMTEVQLKWVLDREKTLDWHHENEFKISESPLIRTYSIYYHGGGLRTWTVDKSTEKVIDWYTSN